MCGLRNSCALLSAVTALQVVTSRFTLAHKRKFNLPVARDGSDRRCDLLHVAWPSKQSPSGRLRAGGDVRPVDAVPFAFEFIQCSWVKPGLVKLNKR